MKEVVYLILFIVGVTALGWVMTANDFALQSVFAPKRAALENKVFHESQAYTDGMVRDLEKLKMEYLHEDEVGKASLRATVVHRFSIYPIEKMPADLQNFYLQLTGG
jgi:hypothetical protein